MTVTLINLSDSNANALTQWALGPSISLPSTPAGVADWLADSPQLSEFCLFWDERLGAPSEPLIRSLCLRPGDVWHAGLALGMSGKPGIIDFVNPVWRFNRDPGTEREATSWRLSLQACLVRSTVLKQLGGPSAQFQTLSGAGLELGHRWLRLGAIMRHRPDLVPANAPSLPAPTMHDEFLFVRRRFGHVWHGWALARTLLTGYLPPSQWRSWWATRNSDSSINPKPLRPAAIDYGKAEPARITVLVPTLERYPYLFQLLQQLGQQTIAPHQVIVVDQTPLAERQRDWSTQFPELPLQVIWRDEPGQCSSRNAGLQAVTGDYILFLDDDDEIPDDLIATHLAFLAEHPADASCGIADELDAATLPVDFTYPRDSDVFPTNNALLKKDALLASGLFDLAYERGSRADGDLGMRLFLGGKQLLLNPSARVLHLHVPRGGLRHHKARATTRANSRASLTRRHLLEPTEGYLWSRYFTRRQIHEACLIRTLATVRGQSTGWRKTIRALLMILLFPLTYYQNRQRLARGEALLEQYPQIPELSEQVNEHRYQHQ